MDGQTLMLEPSRNVRPKYCAFLDLLGSQERLGNFDAALDFYCGATQTLRAVPDQLAELNSFLATDERTKTQADKSFSFNIVSDSFIVSSDTSQWTLAAVFQLAQYGALAGIPLRGAISHGRHFERVEGGHHLILSEAFTRAYDLESKRARVPRIILDPDRLDLFETSYEPTWSRAPFPYLVQCDDGMWCLNPLPFPCEDAAIHAAVQPIETMLATSDRADVKEKCSWLGDFLNMVIWGRDGVYEVLAEKSFRHYVRQNMREGLAVRTWHYNVLKEPKFVLMRGGSTVEDVHPFRRSFAENYATQLLRA